MYTPHASICNGPHDSYHWQKDSHMRFSPHIAPRSILLGIFAISENSIPSPLLRLCSKSTNATHSPCVLNGIDKSYMRFSPHTTPRSLQAFLHWKLFHVWELPPPFFYNASYSPCLVNVTLLAMRNGECQKYVKVQLHVLVTVTCQMDRRIVHDHMKSPNPPYLNTRPHSQKAS